MSQIWEVSIEVLYMKLWHSEPQFKSIRSYEDIKTNETMDTFEKKIQIRMNKPSGPQVQPVSNSAN